jgi:hypothetical protein
MSVGNQDSARRRVYVHNSPELATGGTLREPLLSSEEEERRCRSPSCCETVQVVLSTAALCWLGGTWRKMPKL